MNEYEITFQPDPTRSSVKVRIKANSESDALRIIRAQYPGVRISNFMIHQVG